MAMMPSFELHRPRSVDEALALRAELEDDALWLAGGTELLLAMKMGYVEVSHLIDVKRIDDLTTIELDSDGSLRIGAAAKYHAIRRNAAINHAWPAFAELVSHIGNPRVRTAGTLGGNICFAEPKSDPLIFLSAIGGSVELRSPGGLRRLPVSEFVTGPYSTDIAEHELLVSLTVPPPRAAAYRKFQILERPSLGIALVGDIEAGVFATPPTVAIGGAGTSVTICSAAGELLQGRPLERDDPLVQRAASAAANEMTATSEPFASETYKRHLVKAMLPRMVESLSDRDEEGRSA